MHHHPEHVHKSVNACTASILSGSDGTVFRSIRNVLSPRQSAACASYLCAANTLIDNSIFTANNTNSVVHADPRALSSSPTRQHVTLHQVPHVNKQSGRRSAPSASPSAGSSLCQDSPVQRAV